ncbi:DUF1553 domain-containing protein [Fulvivirgaceae bacterium BMA12]|uniref:DUF1553 domain-containing protein n=1 Tax=Agaribacillus aureus TaxID=3051825 RepID=A0ABT8L1S4_9BACT|nr:DUF1553 domain-containing protein [Fulvivirgaceae bacterium BMA12]
MSFNRILFTLIAVAFLVTGCGLEKSSTATDANVPEIVDFNFHVKPILSDKCFACHGPDEQNQKADLRLDTKEGALAALGDDGDRYPIIPGKPHKSHVYLRITADDPEYRMPPPESNLILSETDVAIISKWIEQGAEYKPHWSFIKPEKPAVPQIEDASWSNNPIDNFIADRLHQEGLKPSGKADRETLIRRLSFDLTGLPPSLEEIDLFLADNSPDAYEAVVDRLLASNGYGERMAATWMDLARYADSDGYLDDKHRDFTPWRDWVIEALNSNMPYDEFVTWQLAGDLIPNATKESVLATAFNRLHRKNSEAGIVFEEFRTEYVADRTQTFGKAFLGLSLECARCHDHKYDPISQENYYQVFGFFNSTNEVGTAIYGPGQTPGPSLLLSTEEQEEIVDFLNKKISQKENSLQQHYASENRDFKNWQEAAPTAAGHLKKQVNRSLIAHYPFDRVYKKDSKTSLTPNLSGSKTPARINEPIIKPGPKGKAFFIDDFSSLRLGEKIGWFDRTDPFSIALWLHPDTLYEQAGIFFHCENLRLGFKGYSFHLKDNKLQFIMAHSWPYNSIQVTTQKAIPTKDWTHVMITYDGSSKANGIKIYMNGEMAPVENDFDNLYKTILYEPDIHTYGFSGFMMGHRDKIKSFKKGGVDELKIYDRELTSLEALYVCDTDNFSGSLENKASKQRETLLKDYYLTHFDKTSKVIRDSLKITRDHLNKVISDIQEIMVMGDVPEPRPTYLLERGVYNARGKEVFPGVPDKIFPFDQDLPSNRLGLSKWLFDKNNPLTARVIVNRIWQMYFGKGIVATSEDFGNQGDLPTHPELLDWLAVEFMDNGWDLKKMHKTIVMSTTYRQSSAFTEELIEKDPENTLLARGPRFRLPAEMIRDNVLSISGLLVDTLGGASAYPYQPAGLWEEISNKPWRYKYLQEPGPGLYRRSLYTIWKRTAPPPSMLIFDVADRSTCVVRRKTTNTPLQALVLLNDPQFLEASRVMAQQVMKTASDTPEGPLQKTFRLATGRFPDETEMALLSDFYKGELKKFTEKPDDALDYLSIGELDWDRSLDPAKLAALTVVANAVVNTDEGYTKK